MPALARPLLRHAVRLALLLALAVGPAFSRAATSVALNGLGLATLPLEGPWQFHTGDNPAWADPSFDDSAWQPVRAGQPWGAQGHHGYTGFGWYRIHIAVPHSVEGLPLALYLPMVDNACEIYWNGRLVGSIGRVPPHAVWYSARTRPHTIAELGPARSGVLSIRVWRAPIAFASQPSEGGLVAIPTLGTSTAVTAFSEADRSFRLRSMQITQDLYLLFFCGGLVALVVWLSQRHRYLLLCIAGVLLFPPIKHLLVGFPGMPFRIGYGLINLVVSLYNIAIWALLINFLCLENRRRLVRASRFFAVVMVVLSIVNGVLECFDWAGSHAHLFLFLDIVTTIPATLLEFWSVVLVVAALRQRLDPARWVLAITAMITAVMQAIEDNTGLGVRWTHWTASHYLNVTLLDIGGGLLNSRDLGYTAFFASVLYVAWRITEEKRLEQSRLEQEFQSARELQQMLIPAMLPVVPGFQVTSVYLPAREVGGDFYQILPLENGDALIILGDVSGKGLTAAMAATLIVGAIRVTAGVTSDPGALLEAVNLHLANGLGGGFATCLALRVSPSGICMAASAGHLPPYRNTEEIALPAALPLGLLPGEKYPSVGLHLAPGDRLTLYTDGIIEARSGSGELFGFPRLAELLADGPGALPVAQAAQHFGQEDDITVLSLQFG